MAVFGDVRFLTYPKELWSGAEAFSLRYYLRADMKPLDPDYGIKDVWGNKQAVTVTLVWGSQVLYGPASLPLLKIVQYPPQYANVAAFDYDQIEHILWYAMESTRDITLNLTLWLEGFTYYTLAPGGDQLTPFTEQHNFPWPVKVKVPTVGASAEYPTYAKVGVPVAISINAFYPYVPCNLGNWRGYIKLVCIGESGEQNEYSLWNSTTLFGDACGTGLAVPASVERDDINIEDITGPIISATRQFQIDIKCGYQAGGIINGIDVDWQRSGEITIPWPIEVAKGVPDIHFISDEFINPPLSVGEDDIFPIKIVVENYWTPGIAYIDCGNLELWRGNLDQYEIGAYQANVNYKDLPGNLGSDNHYTMTFNCGYINESGNKIPVDTIVLSTYITPSVITLTIGDLGGGRTVPPTGIYIYAKGTTVTVKAIPDPGYKFQLWRGDVALDDIFKDTIIVVMDSSKSLSARFELVGDENGEGINIWPVLAIAGGLGGLALLAKGGKK